MIGHFLYVVSPLPRVDSLVRSHSQNCHSSASFQGSFRIFLAFANKKPMSFRKCLVERLIKLWQSFSAGHSVTPQPLSSVYHNDFLSYASWMPSCCGTVTSTIMACFLVADNASSQCVVMVWWRLWCTGLACRDLFSVTLNFLRSRLTKMNHPCLGHPLRICQWCMKPPTCVPQETSVTSLPSCRTSACESGTV